MAKLIKLNSENYTIVDDYGETTYSTDISNNNVYYISLEEVKELLGEVDVEKKAYIFRRNYQDSFEFMNDCIMNDAIHRQIGYEAGYNQAIEDNKENKYTEEDLRKAFEFGLDFENGRILLPKNKSIWQGFIQSIQPKQEWEVFFDEQGKLKIK